MINKITARVAELCLIAGVPSIECNFTLKGKTAGTFAYKGDEVVLNFNLIFANAEPSTYLARTVVHEVAHYVRYARNGFTHDRTANGKRDIHGAKWKAVMRELGAVDETRTHKYDTSLVASGRKLKRFEYSCDAGHGYSLTSIRHNRSIKWAGTKWYTCNECNSQLHFRG